MGAYLKQGKTFGEEGYAGLTAMAFFLWNFKNERIYRRQDAPECFNLTTACYVFKPKYIKKTLDLFSGKVGFVLIPRERSIDIDDSLDYKIANFLAKS